MKGFTLTKELVRFEEKAKDWKDAIRISTQDLVKEGYIQPSYVDGIIDCVVEFGPYIVIAPEIALPHARPEKGAVKPGYSFTRFKEPVLFEDGVDARVFISLSCTESDTHIFMLQEIVEVLSVEENNEIIMNSTDVDKIVQVFQKK